MLKYLNKLKNIYKEKLNVKIMKKEYDQDIIPYIIDSFKGLEIMENIKILDWQWVPDESKYDINDHVVRRNSNKNKVIKNIAETRCGVLYIDIEVSGLDKNGVRQVHYIKKPLIIPIKDENGYYMIKGKKCYLIYQMVDKMLYPYFSSVSIKSLMPINVKMAKEEITDTTGNMHIIPIYTIQIFKSAINILLIYSNFTITNTLSFMEVDRFIKVLDKNNYQQRPDYLYFECGKNSDIVVEVLENIFNKEIYIKSIVGCLVKLFKDTEIKYCNIDNWEEWMIIVGGKNTIRRGVYQHIFFNRLLDDVTKKELKINDYDKQSIYHLLRWVIQNFHELWKKDNLALQNKRLRCNEYIGSFITAEISKRINRLVSLGDKATIKDFLNIFKFPENIFLIRLQGSGVLRYSEINSEMDFESRFKVTKKG